MMGRNERLGELCLILKDVFISSSAGVELSPSNFIAGGPTRGDTRISTTQ